MKRILQLAIIALCAHNVGWSQEMSGFRTDNYNGVNGAFFNPANLADNHFKIDVGIVGLNVFAGNKNSSFSFKTFSDFNADTGALNKLVGSGNVNSIMFNLAVNMPSVSYQISEKTTVAFLSRTRMLFDVRDFDGTLINSINNEAQKGSFPYSISNNTNIRFNVNAFSEFGLSLGQVVLHSGKHFLKVGATVKYLGGIGNGYFQINNLKATIGGDTNGKNAYLTNSSGSIAVGMGGVDINKFDNIQMKFQASGFGADLGLVYEYRPENLSEERIPYQFKLSAALLDIGGIKYNLIPSSSAAYTINISPSQQFNLNAFDGKSASDLKSVLNAYPAYFSPTAGLNNSSYRVSLPSTLQIGGDIRAINRIYVAVNVQTALTSNADKAYNAQSVSGFAITPRFETKMLAVYLPITYNNLSGTNIGLGFRSGPLYAGCASIMSMLFGNSKQADFYFGFRVGLSSKTSH
ncbi:MAG: DUF5723 family protein [Phycisphaerales bacterium]|nr:DUF5723 family protein [Phycisphaerales bacterium]